MNEWLPVLHVLPPSRGKPVGWPFRGKRRSHYSVMSGEIMISHDRLENSRKYYSARAESSSSS